MNRISERHEVWDLENVTDGPVNSFASSQEASQFIEQKEKETFNARVA